MYSPTLRQLRRTHRLPSRETCWQSLRRVRLCSDACLWKSALAWHNSPACLGILNSDVPLASCRLFSISLLIAEALPVGKRAPAHGPDVVVTYQSPSGPAAR